MNKQTRHRKTIYTVTTPDGSAWGFKSQKKAVAQAIKCASGTAFGESIQTQATAVITKFIIGKDRIRDEFINLCIPRKQAEADKMLNKIVPSEEKYMWASQLPA